MSAAKKAASLAVGVVASTVKGYRATRDWLEAKRPFPFR